MIPRRYINEWKAKADWALDYQVEQDLVICRTITAIFSDNILASKLAFRGGTAVHKLFIQPQQRYSEDIDLVQIKAEPIKDILDGLRKQLSFLGEPRIRQKANNNTIIFSFDSEMLPVTSLKLKIETNCREHFSVLGYNQVPFAVQSGWFDGSCVITTYQFDELMGTKLRALYQRRKGRDLYDIYKALQTNQLDAEKVLYCYHEYMNFTVKKIPSQKEYLLNMNEKMADPEFLTDTAALLRPGEEYDPLEAFDLLKDNLIKRM